MPIDQYITQPPSQKFVFTLVNNYGSYKRDPEPNNVCNVSNFRALSHNWNIFINPFSQESAIYIEEIIEGR